MKAVISGLTCMPDLPRRQFLSWDMCRETGSGLVEIGSHTNHLQQSGRSGRLLRPGAGSAASSGTRRRATKSSAPGPGRYSKSYDRITWEVGRPTFFAYPFGVVEMPEAEELVAELFLVTAVTRPGITDLRKGTRQMLRLTVTMDTPLEKLLQRT